MYNTMNVFGKKIVYPTSCISVIPIEKLITNKNLNKL